MRKISEFFNRGKGVLLAVFLLAALFFSNDFGLVDVQKTAIVTAVGVDKEDGKYLLTARVAAPSGKDEKQAFTAVYGRGRTIGEAMNEIGDKTGQVPKLFFCKAILFGKAALDGDLTAPLSYFYRSNYLSSDVLLCATDKTAKELLSEKEGDKEVSKAFDELFSKATEHSGNVTSVNLKDFAISNLSPSAFAYMPVVKKEEDGVKVGDVLLLSAGGAVGVLSGDRARAFALSTGEVKQTVVTYKEETGSAAVTLYDIRVKKKVKRDNGRFIISLDLTANARRSDENGPSDVFAQANGNEVDEDTLLLAGEKLKNDLEKLFLSAKEKKIDIYRLTEDAEKYHYKEYIKAIDGGEDILKSAEAEISVRLSDPK